MQSECYWCCCPPQSVQISRVLRRFESVLPSDAGTLVGTVAKVVGRATQSSTAGLLQSPLSGRPCVYYSVTVLEVCGHGNDKYWREVLTEERGVDFFLEDDAGSCVYVYQQGGMVPYSIEDGIETNSGTGGFFTGIDAASPNLQVLMARHFKSTTTQTFFGRRNAELRATESVFAVGEPLVALGIVTAFGDGGQGVYLAPLAHSAISQEDMDARGWKRDDKRSWNALLKHCNGVLVSDARNHVGNLVTSTEQPVGFQLPVLQHVAAPVQVQPQATRLVTVQVPDGGVPGSTCAFSLPDGTTAHCQIPPGALPGSHIQVEVPRGVASVPVAALAPVQVQPQATRLVTVQVPDGGVPGSTCAFSLPDGTTVHWQIPPGALPGSHIQVQVPPAAPSAQQQHATVVVPVAAPSPATGC